MLGFHPTELIVIFVVALLVFGPKKLPEMGAQLGRGLNAFKKGMREIREPMEDTFDLESFTAQQQHLRSLEAKRLELEILERELAVKRAEAELKRVQAGLPTTVDEENVVSSTIVDVDIAPEEMDHTIVEAAEPVSSEFVESTESKVSEKVESTGPAV